jgi:hypothetical protein
MLILWFALILVWLLRVAVAARVADAASESFWQRRTAATMDRGS